MKKVFLVTAGVVVALVAAIYLLVFITAWI